MTDPEGYAQPSEIVTLKQRERYRKATRDMVLPAFMIKDGREWRLVHYEADILSRVPWDEVDVSPLFDLALGDEGRRDVELRAGLEGGPLMVDPEATDPRTPAPEKGEIDYFFAASHLLDVMPNPWRGREVARRVFGVLLEKHPRERVAGNYVFVLEALRQRLEAERDRLSRRVFAELLDAGTMRFLVVTDDMEFNRLPQTIDTAMGKAGQPGGRRPVPAQPVRTDERG